MSARLTRSLPRATALAIGMLSAIVACADTNEDLPPGDMSAPLPAAEPVAVTFDTATVTFLTDGEPVRMHVEIADRPDQRAYGLMDRDELAQDAGMIFLYDEQQPASSGFWMYRTRIPLDIAFFDGAGRIVAIRQMTPCASLDAARCGPGYTADVPYFGAVEANRGYFAGNGIGVGDRVVLPGRIGG